MKEFYVLASVVWAMIVFGTAVTNSYSVANLFSLSITALVLVYALAIWSVIKNTKDLTLTQKTTRY